MRRTKFRLKRTKHPKIYTVRIEGVVGNWWFVNSHQYINKPYLMTRKRAYRLLVRLKERYYGNFYVKKYEKT